MSWRDWYGTRRRSSEQHLDRELRDHLDLEVEAQEEAGLDPALARRRAHATVGNLAVVREAVREQARWSWWDRARRDVGHALRRLARHPGFTAAAVASLALGLGVTIAIFTIADAALLRRLPVDRPDALVLLTTPDNFSYPAFRDIADGTRTLSLVMAASTTRRRLVGADGDTRPGDVKMVSGGYFEGLGGVPAAGRYFTAAEELDPRAVLSHAFWQTRFGGSPAVLGQAITLDGLPVTVVGVAPAGFFGDAPGEVPAVWTTFALQSEQSRNERGYTWLQVLARRRTGTTLPQVEADVSALAVGLPIRAEDGARGTAGLRNRFGAPLAVMAALAVVAFLMTCTNLGGLLLMSGASRRQELAVRLALGASRRRVIAHLLTENVMLALAGGVAGLLLSTWVTRALLGAVGRIGPALTLETTPDGRVVAMAGALTVAALLLFGVGPAFRSVQRTPGALLGGGSRTIVAGGRRWAIGRSAVVAQVALSLLLVGGAVMFVRTVANLQAQQLGFEPDGLVVASLSVERGHRPPIDVVLPTVVDGVRALPGVQSVSFAGFGTLANEGGIYGYQIEGDGPRAEQDQRARADHVGPAYLQAAGIRLVSGREFSWRDSRSSNGVVIVNETMAAFYFGDRDPIGRRMLFNGDAYDIIGVAGDAKYGDLRDTATPKFVYFASMQSGNVRGLEIRTTGAASPTLDALRRVVREADSRMDVTDLMTMNDRIAAKTGRESMLASLAGAYAALTMILAALGIHGTLAYHLTGRTKELCLRLALGAGRPAIVWTVVRQVGLHVVLGALLGLVAVRLLGPAVESLLFGLDPADLSTFALVLGVIAVTATAGITITAVRAFRLDPARILRED
jgi:predicted permease